MKNKTITFKVTVQNRIYDKMSSIMSRMDLGIESISCPEAIEVSYNTTAEITQPYIKKMKVAIKNAIEQTEEDFKVLEVEPLSVIPLD